MTLNAIYQTVAQANTGFNLQSPIIASQLHWGTLNPNEALPLLKGLQRVYRLYPHVNVALAVGEAGYTSAHAIAQKSQSAFTAQLAPQLATLVPTGTTAEQVLQSIWLNARSVCFQVNIAAGDVLVNPTDLVEYEHNANLPKFHDSMPTWHTLFGPQYTADVNEANSVYGATAYFTDLMRVIDTYITDTSTAIPTGLKLSERRPDLWQIPLNIQNTYHEKGYLTIANQVMSSKLANDFKQDTNQYLATHFYPFSLAINEPLEKIRLYLSHFNFTLAEVYQRFQANAVDVARESLQLALENAALITNTTTSPISTNELFGLYSDETEANLTSLPFFEHKTGLLPAQVNNLVYQNLKPKQWNGLLFKGVADNTNRIIVPNASALQVSDDQTIEFWIYLTEPPPPGGGSNKTVVLNKNYEGEFDFELRIGDDNESIVFSYRCGNSAGTNYINVFTDMQVGIWYHVAVLRDMSTNPPTLKSYSKNAQGVITDPYPAWGFGNYPINKTNNDVTIGGPNFKGVIAEIRIWNRVLSHAEIDNNQWRSLTGKEHGLMAYWPMNDGTGSVLSDLSPFKNNGTLGSSLPTNWQVIDNFYFDDYEKNPALQSQFWINKQSSGGGYLECIETPLGTQHSTQIAYSNNSNQWQLIGRFIHLANQLNWSFADTDWVLNSIQSSQLQEKDISTLAVVAQLSKLLNQPLDAVTALWYDMKTYGEGNATSSQTLFDRVFNTPSPFYNPNGLENAAAYHPTYANNPFYHDAALSWNHTDVSSSTTSTDNLLRTALLSALKLNNTELDVILAYLQNQHLINSTSISLTVQNLSLLYRYACLPQWLGRPVSEFLQLLSLMGNPGLTSPETVLKVVEWLNWLKHSGFSIYQFKYLCNGTLAEQISKKVIQPAVTPFLQQLSTKATATMVTPEVLAGAVIAPNLASEVFNALVVADFCDTQGIVKSERPVTNYAVYCTLLPLLQEGAVPLDKSAFEQAYSNFASGTLTLTETSSPSNAAKQDAVFGIIHQVVSVLQSNMKAQTELVAQQLATVYKLPAPQLAAILEIAERQLPSAPFFNNLLNMGLSAKIPDTSPQTTISFWVNFRTLSSSTEKVTLYSTLNGNTGIELSYSENQGCFTIGSSYGIQVHLPETVESFTFYHILLSYTQTNEQYNYVWSFNGKINKGALNTAYQPAVAGGQLTLGYSNTAGNYFSGQIIHFQQYSSFVSDTNSILDHFQSGDVISNASLQIDWRFNARDNSTVYDWSGNEHHATLTSNETQQTWEWHDYSLRQLLSTQLTPLQVSDMTSLFEQLSQLTAWAKWFKLSADELKLIPLNPEPFDIPNMRYGFRFNLNQLRAFVTYKSLHANYSLPDTALLNYFNNTSTPIDKTQALANIMGWPNEQLITLETNFKYGQTPLAFPNDYDNFNTVNGVNSLARCFEISTTMGVDIAFFFELRKLSALKLLNGNTATDNTNWQYYVNASDSLEKAVTANYKYKDVQSVLEPIQNTIELIKRKVMSDLLIWELGKTIAGINSEQDLYEYLLIDVRMTNAMQISVLKAGLNSLQLYIQRCLSNLENGVTCTLPKEWWTWMGSYREWQANREIYIYPENYVDPTLRKLQSPLFKNLVNEVKQQTASNETVTKAYLNYLDGLRDIANLEIVDSYARALPNALENSTGRVLDVFGRSHTSPIKFYHRTAIVSDPTSTNVQWTPWEDTGLTINSDFVTPVYAFGKLFIFWVEQSNASTTIDGTSYPYISATIYYAFKKASSAWTTPQVLAGDVIIKTYNAQSVVNDFYFKFQLNNFNPLSPYETTKAWNKVSAIALPASNKEDEQLLITLGNFVDWVNDTHFTFTATDTPKTPEQHKVYDYLTALKSKVLPHTGSGKVTTVVPGYVLDSGLRMREQMPLIDASLLETYKGFVIEHNGNELLCFLQANEEEVLTDANPFTEAFIRNTSDNNIHHAWYNQKGIISAPAISINGPFGDRITCLYFSGNADYYVSLLPPKSLSPVNKKFTYGMWVQFKSLTQTGVLLNLTDSTVSPFTGSMASLNYSNNSQTLTYRIFNTPNASFQNVYLEVPLGSDKKVNQWYYIAVANSNENCNLALYDPTELTWEHASLANVNFVPPHHGIWLGVSDTGGNDPFNGYITGIQVFNKYIAEEAFFDILVGKQTPNMGLSTLPKGRSSVVSVSNQPGWFFLNAGKESFMVVPTTTVNDLLAPRVSVSYGDYVSVSIAASGSTSSSLPQYNFIRTSTNVLDELIEKVGTGGIANLLKPANQLLPEIPFDNYSPYHSQVTAPYPLMDFNGAYGQYFWELFYHIPFYLAENLQSNLKFASAKTWYEYIFDPNASLIISNAEDETVQSPLYNNLVALWPLGITGGVAISPSTQANYNGQTSGLSHKTMPSVPFSDNLRTVSYFSGTNASIHVPYTSSLNTTSFSISFWVRIDEDLILTGNDAFNSIVTAATNTSGYQIQLYKWENDAPTFLVYAYDTDGAKRDHQLNNVIELNTWYQFCLCCDGQNINMYVQSEKDSTIAHYNFGSSLNFAPNTSSDLIIGAGMKGYLANVAYWNTCLSADEVSTLYSHSFASDILTADLIKSKRFWQFVPFRELHYTSLYNELVTTSGQYLAYEYDPFDPDAIASQRPSAYAKGIFMRYISNLIDFGDNLFTQDTWESITEATMYYVLAKDLLGKPAHENKTDAQTTVTYNTIDSVYQNEVPTFLINLETMPALPAGLTSAQTSALEQRWSVYSAYFGIPANTQLETYRKTIEDRLYKIRHGLNIAGQTNNIPLFEPPINPADAAAAAGPGGAGMSSISSAAPSIPYYRFDHVIEVARNFTNEVIRLGESLLAALEKQDAEYLSLLHETQANAILVMMTQIKTDQINQLYAEQSNLQSSLANAQYEYNTYQNWINAGWNGYEISQISLLSVATGLESVSAIMGLVSSPMYLVPSIFGLADGGMNWGGSFEALAQSLKGDAEVLNSVANLLGMKGNFDRTNDQWKLQLNLAANSINGINAQLQANSIALQSAQQDYNVNQTQISQSNTVINFLQTKFTNEELYEWMASEVASVYYQAYQLACGLAQMAQTAYQFELSKTNTYINTSSWSNQYKGLLAGNGLMLSLNQLQQAYITQNNRQLEISRTISLARLNPTALISLKENGTCSFTLSEYLFDTDFPGHYNRKIKTIAITIPAIVGPYQNIKASLIQTSNTVVTKANVEAVNYLLHSALAMPTDGSIRMNWNAGQEIALTTGTSDTGMFQLNYNDERFLPFENTGAVSSWQLNMPKAANQIDFNSINDVIIELKYTADDGGSTFRKSVLQNPKLQTYNGTQLISMRQQFPDVWQQFLTTQQATLNFVRKMYPPNLSSVALVPSDTPSVILIPVLSTTELVTDISDITLDNNSWDSSENSVTFKTPVTVTTGQTINWVLSTEVANDSELLNDNKDIDPKKWLDIILIIPYEGTYDWG